MKFLICLSALNFVTFAANSPEPFEPGDSYAFPENYCDNFNPRDAFDFVVVGAGPAGASVARRLAEHEHFNILLLEAGDDPPPESDIPANVQNLKRNLYWDFKTAPTKTICQGFLGKSCVMRTGKVLGGSSVINFMVNARGNSADFDEIAELGNPGWSTKDILPYFKKVESYIAPRDEEPVYENVDDPSDMSTVPPEFSTELPAGEEADEEAVYHGIDGPITHTKFQIDPFSQPIADALSKAFEEFDIHYNPDINGKSQMGYTTFRGSVDELGYRYSAAKGYLSDVPKNLKVCKNSIATKLLFKGKNATSLEFLYTGKKRSTKMVVKASKEYIISGGPYNSPALLERSGIGRRDILKKLNIPTVQILNGVGENLHNHFYNFAGAFKVGNIGTVASPNPLSIGISSLGAFVNNTDERSSIPDHEVTFRFYDPRVKEKVFGVVKPDIMKQYTEAGLVIINLGVYFRNPPGSTHISQTADPRITPIIKETPFGTKEASDREISYMRIKRKYMASAALEKFQIEPLVLKECQKYPYNSDKEIMCGAALLTRPAYHGTGSASMGPTSDKYVVDPRLKVHGIGNVRVIDSSILPLSPRAPTQAASYVVGEKGADLIKEDYGVRVDRSN